MEKFNQAEGEGFRVRNGAEVRSAGRQGPGGYELSAARKVYGFNMTEDFIKETNRPASVQNCLAGWIDFGGTGPTS